MPLISLSEARAVIARTVAPLKPVSLALANAAGRTVREDVVAPEDVPAFDRSAMDGYAVALEDQSERFRVVTEIQAGQVAQVEVHPGECARIYTGAPIPRGANQVIMQEEVTREGEWMTPRQRDRKTWIRQRGEDARAGDRMLVSSARLGAGELSLLAQLGHVRPLVSPAARVLHFTTGDELVDPGTQPGAGQIRDSNSILVATLLADAGAKLIAQARCGDTLDALTQAVTGHATDSWDALLISGGASVGDYDFGVRALEALGFTIHFRQINLRPGKPLVFATRGAQCAFVIPGNPVSHFVTFHLAIRLALDCLEGRVPAWAMAPVQMATTLATEPNPRDTWWLANVTLVDGSWRARPLAWQSSGDVSGLVSANALLPLPGGSSNLTEGENHRALLLRLGM